MTAQGNSVPLPWGKSRGYPLWLPKSTLSVTAQLSFLGLHMTHAVPLLMFSVTTLRSVKCFLNAFNFIFFQE